MRLPRLRPAVAGLVALLLAGCTSTAGTPGPSGSAGPPSSPGPSLSDRPSSSPPPPAPSTTAVQPPPGTTPAQVGDDVPAVVRLAWLGRQPATPGLTTKVGTHTRWQGTTPGEYALVDDDGYSWFGADGSVVGCDRVGRCIGIDRDGYLAVVVSRGERLVYTADGKPVGRFTADARPLKQRLPSYRQAIADSGIDLQGLLDAATRPVPFAGAITGDPHVITAGRQRYSMQLTGEFEAATDPQRHIQVRLQSMPHQPSVSLVTGAAVRTGTATVEFSAEGGILVDGVALGRAEAFEAVPLGGGTQLGRWPARADGVVAAVIGWPDGSSVSVTMAGPLGLTLVAFAAGSAVTSGLFGTGRPQFGSDLRDRSGGPGDSPATAAASWLRAQGESLFRDPVDPEPVVAGDPAFPPDAALPFGEQACQARGVVQGPDLAACRFDVALTGDDGFAAGHAQMVAAATTTVSPQLTRRWTALTIAPAAAGDPLPALVDVLARPATDLVYRFAIAEPGALVLQFSVGCPEPDPLPQDVPAVRVFDSLDRPVSARVQACGIVNTGILPAGELRLVVAAPRAGPALQVRFDAAVPG